MQYVVVFGSTELYDQQTYLTDIDVHQSLC